MRYYTLLIIIITTYSSLSGQGLTLFNDNFLHEIQLNNVDTMIFINGEAYQSVDMIIDGAVVSSVGLKQKGNISASHGNNKLPFKIKINEYVNGQEFDGIREFTLNNSFQDPSMMREKMTYDLSGELGLNTLRTAYAKVYIDTQYWGVYTIVEGKDEMFHHVFGNRSGDAIESTDFGNLCYEGSNKSDYYNGNLGDYIYIVDNGDENTAWFRLINMLDIANNTTTDYVNTVDDYLNIVDFTKYQAMNVYLLNFDSYIGFVGNQLYFFDENTNVWQVIPWDFNASFGLWNTQFQNPFSYPILPNDISNGCIAEHISIDASLQNQYYTTMCDLTSTLMDTMVLNAKVDNWKAQIQAAIYQDWRKEFSNTDFDNATNYGYYFLNNEQVPALKTFAKDRYETISNTLSNLNINCTNSTLSVNNMASKLKIYPNPATEKINLTFSNQEKTTDSYYQIINLNGQMIQQGQIKENTINTSALKSGIYFLKYFDAKGNREVVKLTIL